MTDLTFRPAGGDETETVFTLLREAAVWLRDKGIDYWQNWLDPPEAHVAWIKRGFDRCEFFVVERKGEVVGCFRLQSEDAMFWGARNDSAGYIHSITTRRDLAGTGAGRRVLELIEVHCVDKGKQFLRLDCGSSISGLRRYYESCGFLPVGETTVAGEQLTLYEKPLTHSRVEATRTNRAPRL